MEEKYIPVAEFAPRAKVTASTIYNMCSDGSLKWENRKLARRTIKVIPESELKKFRI